MDWSWPLGESVTSRYGDLMQGAIDKQLQSTAVQNIGNLSLAGLGVGAAGRGLIGLLQNSRRNLDRAGPSTRSGPSVMSLPYPVEEEEDPAAMKTPKKKAADIDAAIDGGWGPGPGGGRAISPLLLSTMLGSGIGTIGGTIGHARQGKSETDGATRGGMIGAGTGFGASLGGGLGMALGNQYGLGGAGGLAGMLGGGLLGYKGLKRVLKRPEPTKIEKDASTKTAYSKVTAIPWYRPAMALGGLAGLGLGWKGIDHILDKRRQIQSENELEDARTDFHDAILSQYDRPLRTVDSKKAASDQTSTQTTLVEELGDLFDLMQKTSADFEAAGGFVSTPLEKRAIRLDDVKGEMLGGYGTYAALSGLMSGAMVYDRARKRQQRALIEKAVKERQRQRQINSPAEIIALPEPIKMLPKPDFKQEMSLVSNPEG